jgi:hypothetical protein
MARHIVKTNIRLIFNGSRVYFKGIVKNVVHLNNGVLNDRTDSLQVLRPLTMFTGSKAMML